MDAAIFLFLFVTLIYSDHFSWTDLLEVHNGKRSEAVIVSHDQLMGGGGALARRSVEIRCLKVEPRGIGTEGFFVHGMQVMTAHGVLGAHLDGNKVTIMARG